MNVIELVLYLRLAERAIANILLIGVIIFLIVIYRNEVNVQPLSAEFGSIKIATTITVPIVISLILLGYFYVTVSNPISYKDMSAKDRASQVLFFDNPELSQTFTNLAGREGGLDKAMIARAQSLLRLALDVEKLRREGSKENITPLLNDNKLSVDDIRQEVTKDTR